MGRPRKYQFGNVEWTICLNKTLAQGITEEMFRRGRNYGARSELLTELLTKWLNENYSGPPKVEVKSIDNPKPLSEIPALYHDNLEPAVDIGAAIVKTMNEELREKEEKENG